MMIFKRWFKPKWQHQDPSIRMSAIASLDQADHQQKEVLHELAFNDGAEQVRRAALERLNEFSLWWQASKHESADRLKQFAEQQLVDMLLQNRVSPSLKQTFIAECNRSSILEKLALLDQDQETRYQLLRRLQRQDLFQLALQDETLTFEHRKCFVSLIDDDKVLERLSRHAIEPLKTTVLDELAHRLEQREKPEKLRKQLVLLLAKLNAVRERSDVLAAWQTWQDLLATWNDLAPEFSCLADAEEFTSKFSRIEQQTMASLWPRVEAAQQAAFAQQQAALLQQQADGFANDVAVLNTAIANDVAAGDLDIAAEHQGALERLTRNVLQANLPESLRQPLVKQLAKLQQLLDSLPQLAEQLAQMARALADLTAQPLPSVEDVESAWQGFLQWQKQWDLANKQLPIALPEHFQSGYQQLVTRWQQHCQPLLANQQKQIKLLKNKLQEFKRLHADGRYNLLFGLLKGIEQQALALPSLPAVVEKDLVQAREQVAALSDLQAYIATPRKQELITTMTELAAEPVGDVKERAQLVKQARQQWNSLGRADETLDAQLNDQFNQLCEVAFAPCRDFYAEQDAQRLQAAQRKQELIERMTACAFADAKDVEKQLQIWQKEWDAAGATERELHQTLVEKYRALVQAARTFIKQHQQHAAQRKQDIILSAQQAVASDAAAHDVGRQLKQLQQVWKATGYAGKKAEQDLWQQFRQVCDGFFAKREADKQQWQQQQVALLAQQRELLLTLSQDDVTPIAQRLNQLNQTHWQDELQAEVKTLQANWQGLLVAQRELAQREQIEQLLVLLAKPDLQAHQLPAVYRLVFATGQEQSLTRAQLTIAMELVAGVDSPTELSAERQQVQMALLSQKLNQGEELTVPALFGRWLQYGVLSAAELPLLPRIGAVLLKHS